ADESSLSKRGQAADAGQQNQAKRGNGIDTNVVHQRNGEGAKQRRRYCDECDDGRDNDAGAPAHQAPSSSSVSSSTAPPVMSDCQISTGMSAPKTSTSLKAESQNAA